MIARELDGSIRMEIMIKTSCIFLFIIIFPYMDLHIYNEKVVYKYHPIDFDKKVKFVII
jgi:hypothetical protein